KYIGYAHSGEDVILKSRAGNVRLIPVDKSEETAQGRNKVYIEDGEVKVDIETETMEPEELRVLLHKMVDLEYSLP
ncbi:MAG: hypothetical protein J6Z14_02810, partial [Prevotella sp.]|nr:hypothetical protein [Prevotella sp.]